MSFKISYKKILLLVVLSGTIGCTNLNSFFKRGQSRGPSVKIFSEGKTYVNLEELKRKKGETRTHFDHPKYLNKTNNGISSFRLLNDVFNVLSPLIPSLDKNLILNTFAIFVISLFERTSQI